MTWDPPANVGRFDIESYIIYIPSRNIRSVSFSTTIDLTIPNCRDGNNSIQVAAVNRLGCVGPNTSHIPLSLVEMQDPGKYCNNTIMAMAMQKFSSDPIFAEGPSSKIS